MPDLVTIRPAARHARARVLRLAVLLILAPAIAGAGEPAPTDRDPGAAARAGTDAGRRDEGRQPVGRVRGTVLDPSRRPVPGLLVQLASRDDRGLLRVTGTDAKGQYAFQDLPAGIYDVEVSMDGYRAQTKGSIAVRPPFQNIVDFQLTREGALSPTGPAAGPPHPAGSAAAGEPALPVTVQGLLTDKEKHPVVEASVILIGLQDPGIFQMFSGEDGRFLFPSVPPGTYRALIASPGHVTLDLKSVQVSAVSGLDLSLMLVDYPLNSRGREKDLLPREKPDPGPLDAEPAEAVPAPPASPS